MVMRVICLDILTEHLGLTKICVRFVTHKLTNDQKLLRMQHCKDLFKEDKKDTNCRKFIVTYNETWCFQYNPETKHQSAE